MNTLFQDVRFGLRMLAKSPGFTAVVMLTLAIGIGANTAIFTLVHAIMLKSLPVGNPAQLYRVGSGENCCVIGEFQDNWGIYSYDLYKQFRDHTPQFSQLAAFQGGRDDLSVRRAGSSQTAQPFIGEFVSGNYFQTFGLSAFLGRPLTAEDDKPGAAPVAVMSYRAWQQNFGSDSGVVGATMIINTVPYTVVGVAPPGFYGDRLESDPPHFWFPLATEPGLRGRNSMLNGSGGHWLYVIGRLRPGANVAAVQAELTAQLQHWIAARPDVEARDRPNIPQQHIALVPGGAGVQQLQFYAKDGLRLLAVLSGLVLLIACANIANLLLARAAARHGETAIRAALGAARWRMIRQMVVESVLLAVLGGAAGLYVAYGAAGAILQMAFRGAHYVPISAEPSMPVLAFALFISLLTGIVFGAAPAWFSTRVDPADALRGAGRGMVERGALTRRSLVVVQVALSATLLVGAGLLTRSLGNLEDQQFGFVPEGKFIVRFNPALAGYAPEKLGALYQQLEPRLRLIPGVLSAAYSQYSPMQFANWEDNIHVEGHPPDERIYASFLRVSPHYFETIGTRLLRGRLIGEQDTSASRAVAVVSEAFVRKYFPKDDPIGKHFGLDEVSNSQNYEIVGVVADTKYTEPREAVHPFFFLPFLQHPQGEPAYMVRSQYAGAIELRVAGRPENLQAAVRRTLSDINPDLTVLDMVSFEEQVSRNFNQERLISQLTSLFGLVALILACVGLYGVTAFTVARRTNEIGIRRALGAGWGSVLSLVMRGVAWQVGLGLLLGIPLALAGGKLLESELYGVKSYDPLIVAMAAMVLIACTVAASLVPARRAIKVDPMVALRYE